MIAPNPVNSVMVSISSCDWGLWSPDTPKVEKMPLPSKGLCAAWTVDGQVLAIGMLDGTVLLLNNGSEERCQIHRPAPV